MAVYTGLGQLCTVNSAKTNRRNRFDPGSVIHLSHKSHTHTVYPGFCYFFYIPVFESSPLETVSGRRLRAAQTSIDFRVCLTIRTQAVAIETSLLFSGDVAGCVWACLRLLLRYCLLAPLRALARCMKTSIKGNLNAPEHRGIVPIRAGRSIRSISIA